MGPAWALLCMHGCGPCPSYPLPPPPPVVQEQLERFDHTLALYCTDSHAIEKRRTVLTSQNAGGRPSSNAVLTALYWVHMYMHAKFSTLHALCQKCEPFLHHLKVSGTRY